MQEPLLQVDGLEAAYGPSQVLFGVSLRIAPGQVATLLGRNGVGKTTTVKSIMGILAPRAGTVAFGGRPIAGLPSYRIAQAGIGLVPEGRQIFPNLTVRENLVATAANRRNEKDPWTLERVFDLFSNLKERQGNYGNQLSGGEQQMLAIGRALMSRPRLLLLDEPSLGLAPLIVRQIFDAVARIAREEGVTVFLVEQNAYHALRLADRGYVLVNGRVRLSGSGRELLANAEVRSAYLEGGQA